MIFFSDGQPTAFRGLFRYRGVAYDAHRGAQRDLRRRILRPQRRSAAVPEQPHQRQRPHGPRHAHGDGLASGSACGNNSITTRWYIFNTIPVSGYGPTACNIPARALGNHLCATADNLALQHAAELKNKHIIIYTIGLGDGADAAFMRAVASGPSLYYHSPNSSQLTAVFQQVAQEIKLRLVQ